MAADQDAPTGLPSDDAPESQPLGPPEARPDGEGTTGPEHMPGIPDDGHEPPSSG